MRTCYQALLLVSCFLFLTNFPVVAAPLDEARQWVDKGLETARTLPNSDEEAACYENAVQVDPKYAAAHFNLAYVLHQQALEEWRRTGPTWHNTRSLYRALEHYSEAAGLDPSREPAFKNALQVADLLLRPSVRIPPNLYEIRERLRICASAAAETADAGTKQCMSFAAQRAIELEDRIAALLDRQVSSRLVPSEEIRSKLNRTFTRGQSPYKGPKVPLMIRFEMNRCDILPESHGQLRELARALESGALKDKRILIEGHTQCGDSPEGLRRLSLSRADSVKRYLVDRLQLKEERFEIRGYGDSRPLVPNDTEEHQAMNRRVEFTDYEALRQFKAGVERRSRSGDMDIHDGFY